MHHRPSIGGPRKLPVRSVSTPVLESGPGARQSRVSSKLLVLGELRFPSASASAAPQPPGIPSTAWAARLGHGGGDVQGVTARRPPRSSARFGSTVNALQNYLRDPHSGAAVAEPAFWTPVRRTRTGWPDFVSVSCWFSGHPVLRALRGNQGIRPVAGRSPACETRTARRGRARLRARAGPERFRRTCRQCTLA